MQIISQIAKLGKFFSILKSRNEGGIPKYKIFSQGGVYAKSHWVNLWGTTCLWSLKHYAWKLLKGLVQQLLKNNFQVFEEQMFSIAICDPITHPSGSCITPDNLPKERANKTACHTSKGYRASRILWMFWLNFPPNIGGSQPRNANKYTFSLLYPFLSSWQVQGNNKDMKHYGCSFDSKMKWLVM